MNGKSDALGPGAPKNQFIATHFSIIPYLNLMVTMVLFGSAFASSKVVVGVMPPEVAAALRFMGGAIILALVGMLLKAEKARMSFSKVVRVASVGLVGVFAYNIFFFWGLSLAPSVDGTIIVPVLSPILTVILLFFLGKEKANLPQIIGLGFGGLGAVIFLVSVGGSGDRDRFLGDLIFVIAALCWACYSILSKKVLKGVDPLKATTWGVFAGAFLLLIFALPHLKFVNWEGLDAVVWANIAFLAIGPTAVAYLFYFRGLREVSPTVATILMFTVPVIGSFCAFVFLGERLNFGQLIGALILLIGAIFAVVGPQLVHRFWATKSGMEEG